MIGAILGAGGSLASSLIGGIASRKAAKKSEDILNKQHKYDQDYFTRMYNQDYSQTPEVQWALTQARDMAQERLRSTRGAQKVTGGTEESVAQTMDSNNELTSDVLGKSASNWTAYKNGIASDWQKSNVNWATNLANIYGQRAQDIATQAGNASQGFTNLAAADIESMLNNSKGLFGDSVKKNVASNKNNPAFSDDNYNRKRFKI